MALEQKGSCLVGMLSLTRLYVSAAGRPEPEITIRHRRIRAREGR